MYTYIIIQLTFIIYLIYLNINIFIYYTINYQYLKIFQIFYNYIYKCGRLFCRKFYLNFNKYN